jgi:RNA binding exosome subunit
MSYFARVEARAYSRATEIVERVNAAVLSVFPEELRSKVQVTSATTEAYNQIPIVVITAAIDDKPSSEVAADYLLKALSPNDKETLINTIKQRLDERCVLFIRVDKQAACLGHLQLATEPDVISVQVHIRQYPRCNQEKAITYIQERLASVEG